MVGVVRSGDSVIHITDTEHPTKLLVIWLPGGEASRIFSRDMETIAPLELRDADTFEN